MKLFRRMSQMYYLLIRLIAAFAIAAYANSFGGANADEPTTDSTALQLEKLVEQLGDDSFRKRERAGEELLKFGLQTKAALLAGMKNSDLEIVDRCGFLWHEVRLDAGWQQVQAVIGNSPESRGLFDQMFWAAPELWYEVVEQPIPPAAIFEDRKELLRQMRDKQVIGWEGSLANLLYFGILAKRTSPDLELARVDDLLATRRSQQSLRDNAPMRVLWEQWTGVTGSDGSFDRLLIALSDRRPQAAEIARELLRDEATPASQRQYAILALATSDMPEDEKLLSDSLTDSSSLDVLFAKGIVIKSQLRDVALAVQIYRNRRNPKDFGFVFLRPDDSTLYSPSSLGFRDETERVAAFKKWATFANQQGDAGSP